MCQYYLKQETYYDKYAQKRLKVDIGMSSNDPRVTKT